MARPSLSSHRDRALEEKQGKGKQSAAKKSWKGSKGQRKVNKRRRRRRAPNSLRVSSREKEGREDETDGFSREHDE